MKQLVLAAALIIVVAAGLAASGVVSLPGQSAASARPSCDKLSSKDTVEKAVAANPGLVGKLQAAGPTVKVTVATPCTPSDKAIVHVSYGNDGERKAIETVLQQETGFGVSVELAKA